MAPFDLVVLLIVSESVQDSLIGNDTLLVGGLISVVCVVALNHVVAKQGRPRVLIRPGRIQDRALSEERVSRSELIEAMRREGHTSLACLAMRYWKRTDKYHLVSVQKAVSFNAKISLTVKSERRPLNAGRTPI
jgi:hypothetical protein